MTERRYDDFRITLSARPDGTFDARAVGADGAAISGEFRLPVAADELERVVVRIAHEAPRGAASGGDAVPPCQPAGSGRSPDPRSTPSSSAARSTTRCSPGRSAPGTRRPVSGPASEVAASA